MSFLIELRALLMDSRIALRNALPDFDEHPLQAKMRQAILDISEFTMPPPAANTKTTAQQVALAWQTVSRGLKLTQPALYDEMSSKVMALLDERELVEPVTELLQLDAQVKRLEAGQKSFQTRLSDFAKKSEDAQLKLEQLYHALAMAAPQVGVAPDPQALALLRIDTLMTRASTPQAATTPAPVEGPVPDRVVLEAVAANRRVFSREQREWAVAECLALTGWQQTPIELIERGDSWMAQQLLAAPNAPA